MEKEFGKQRFGCACGNILIEKVLQLQRVHVRHRPLAELSDEMNLDGIDSCPYHVFAPAGLIQTDVLPRDLLERGGRVGCYVPAGVLGNEQVNTRCASVLLSGPT